MRRFVIGDIHGCAKALRTLIETIQPQAHDELVFLGDFVDRGPDTPGVIDLLIELTETCNVIALRGNHEIMLLSVACGSIAPEAWLESGGNATVNSYGGSLEKIPDSHMKFFHSLRPYYETENAIFVHASYEPHLDMKDQTDEYRYWKHMIPDVPGEHHSGKRVFVGHTPQAGGEVLDLGYLVCVDTYCFGNGYLTAMNVATGEIIQVDKKGFRRRVPAEALIHLIFRGFQWTRAKIGKPKRGPSSHE